MLLNTNELHTQSRIECDLCIAGAGAAGISMALQLAGTSLEVCLLEGGGTEFAPTSQDLYRGAAGPPLGAPYVHSSRLRFLGGTTNHWLGFCRPLDPIDFAERPWIANSGWPLGAKDLAPYYPEACRLCEVSENFGPPQPLTNHKNNGVWVVPLFYGPPTRFGTVYRDALQQAENIRLYFHANVLNIALHPSGKTVDHLQICRDDGNPLKVRAKTFVLALGGIENSRLLLLSNDVQPQGVGNNKDLVGRYFMEHPVYPIGTATTLKEDSWLTRTLDRSDREYQTCRLSDSLQEKHQLANSSLGLHVLPTVDDSRGEALQTTDLEAAANFLEAQGWSPEDRAYFDHLRHGAPSTKLRLRHFDIRPEQLPNPESRITLSEQTDRFGLRQPRVDWRLMEQDFRNLQLSAQLLAQELGKQGLGRLRLASPGPLEASMTPGFHHMGGTRMGSTPTTAVVDHNAKVFGVDNLYMAGSSVFPTCGYANPTLTLVALALRLTNHLQQQLHKT